MRRLVALGALAIIFSSPALAQGLPWNTDTLRRGDEVLAGVQHRVEDGVRRERLRFSDPEQAKAWAVQAVGDGERGAHVLIEVRGKRVVVVSGDSDDPALVEKALAEAWGEDEAQESPQLCAVRDDDRVALLGSDVPPAAASKLKAGLKVDAEAARPLAKVLGKRKVALPAAPPASGGLVGGLPGS